MLLIMTVALSAQQAHAFYLDRWGIEHPPLVAKQLLGAQRQFVFAAEARQRLPELSLLAGSILSYVAAGEVAIPTGFWDRNPKSTPGRLRRLLTKEGHGSAWLIAAQNRLCRSPWRFHPLLFASRFKHDLAESKGHAITDRSRCQTHGIRAIFRPGLSGGQALRLILWTEHIRARPG